MSGMFFSRFAHFNAYFDWFCFTLLMHKKTLVRWEIKRLFNGKLSQKHFYQKIVKI